MPIDIYQAFDSKTLSDDYYQIPLSAEYVTVGPGIVVPLSSAQMNGLGKRKQQATPEEEEEKQTQVYLSAPLTMTQGENSASSQKRQRGKGFYLAGQGGRDRFDQSGGAARVQAVAGKLIQRAYPAVFRGLGAALHHRSMQRLMHGRGMKGTGKVGTWFRKAGKSIKGALKTAGHWAKEKLWQPLLERAKKMFGDFVRDKLKQYIPDSIDGVRAKADELLDKAFSWISGKLPPAWSVAANAAFEVLRSPLREIASSAIKKGFESLHKASDKTGINLNFDKTEETSPAALTEQGESSSSNAEQKEGEEDIEVPDGESSGKGYGGHMFGGRKISSAQLSALVRNHAMKKFDSKPGYLDAFASF